MTFVLIDQNFHLILGVEHIQIAQVPLYEKLNPQACREIPRSGKYYWPSVENIVKCC